MKKIFSLSVLVFLAFFNVSAQEVNRTAPPELPPPAKLNLPPVQQLELSNGLKVYLMEKHEVPLMQMNIVVRCGIVNDPSDKTGLASMALAMLTEGAAGQSSLELADSIDYLGARIGAGADFHFSHITLHTPVSKFDDALKIFSDIVLRPDFPANELERKKKERLTRIMQWHDDPNSIAGIAFNKLLFGNDYVYGKPSIGDESTIKSFTADDLKKFHKKFFNAANSFIVAVGDIQPGELKAKLENAFGKWQKGESFDQKLENAPQVNKRIIYIIDKPGAPQSVIYVGRIGVKRNTEDFDAITVMNTILGGSYTSRLNQNLRERNGYTYGASSYFAARKAAGAFLAGSSVQSEVTDKALTEFMNELNGIIQPIPAEEINKAKNYMALSYPQNFQSVDGIAGEIEDVVEYDLPADYFNTYITKILNISGDEVNAAAKKYIDPKKIVIVIVGDRAKIEESIKKLNLGEIKNLSIDDVLGKVPEIK